MEIDLARAPQSAGALERKLRSRVCILGGGVAALALASQLEAQTKLDLTLLESGGSVPYSDAGADPFGAELRGTPHVGTREGRVRAFGGTSHTWGGQLLPPPEDSAWPIVASPTSRLLPRTLPVDAAAFFTSTRQSAPALLGCLPGMISRVSYFLPFTQRNLARVWGDRLRQSPRARVVIHATVLELLLAPEGHRVEAVLVRGWDGGALRIEADHFVVAAGTVETCRLMLASRVSKSAGIGNDFGQVGRHFHDHLTCSAAELTGAARATALAQLRPWIFSSPSGKQVLYSLKLEAGAALREQLGIPPAMAHLTIEEPEGMGVAVLRRLLRARQSSGLRGELRGAWRRLPGALAQGLKLAWEARFRHRRYVSQRAKVFLQINLAQQPSDEMRISLGEGRGGEGLPHAVVHWEVSGADLSHLREFAGYLRERLSAASWPDGIVWLPGLFGAGVEADAALRSRVDDARHAMGGACMGTDPRSSVVDPELRVHGIRNLSVASAAVFPDGGAQLPTATLISLCERLAERLGRELG